MPAALISGICSIQWWSHRKASTSSPRSCTLQLCRPQLLPVCFHTVQRIYAFSLPCSQSIVAVTRPLPGTGLAGVGEVLKWEQVSSAPAEDGAAAAEVDGRQAVDTSGTGGLLLHQFRLTAPAENRAGADGTGMGG